MADYIIVEGDLAVFMPAFGAAIVQVRPGRMPASGKTTLQGKKICLQGDEGQLVVAGCTYMTPQYPSPGMGTLKIAALGGDQTSRKTQSGGKAIILKGSTFQAKFEVQVPAMDVSKAPAPPIPDLSPQYAGSGNFVPTNVKFSIS